MYSAFIAYHGSMDKNGSFSIANTIKLLLNSQRTKYEVYCGPDTDQHTFEDHFTRVIPNSELFILVVNDYVPVDQDGALDEVKCEYLAGEIKAFLKLVQSKQRNVKNFTVHYFSGLPKSVNEKRAFVRTLLSKIDPNEDLFTGNQYYVQEVDEILKWYKNYSDRTILDNPFTLDYVPFTPLEEALKDVINSNQHSSFLLEMKKGMGKTTFIKHIRDDLYPRHCVSIFFSRDEGYASIGKFKKDFVSQLVGDNEEKFYLEDYGELNKENFAKYVNDYKHEFYSDSPLLICLDSIDDATIIDEKCPVLDLFSDFSLFDEGIFFVFTSKIPEEGKSYNAYISKFITNFIGEKMKVDDQDIGYLKYLYLYYSNTVSKNFNVDQVDLVELFDNVKPKNILTFSLLFYISNLYLSSHEDRSIEIIKSTENALKFYYSYMKEHSEISEDYQKSLIGLYILSISSKPLTLDKLDDIALECFNFKISSSFVKYKNALSILVNSYQDVDGKTVFDIRHEKIKEMVEEDENNSVIKTTINNVMSFAFMELSMSKMSFLDFASSHKTVQFLFTSYFIKLPTKEKKMQVLRGILSSLTTLSWGDMTEKITAQHMILERIVTLPEFGELSDIERAMFLSRLSIDEQQIDYNYDSYLHSLKSCELFEAHENELDDRGLYFYMDATSALGNVSCRISINVDTVALFRKSTDICEILFNKGLVPLRDYTNNLLAFGNVSNNIGGDLDTDEKCLKRAHELIFSSNDPMDLGQRGWYYQRLSNFHRRKGDNESAEKEKLLAYDAYLVAFDAAPNCFYFGNLIEAASAYLAIKTKNMQEKGEIFDFIGSIENKIMQMAKQVKFHSVRNFVSFYSNIGDIYCKHDNIELGVKYYRKALNEINVVKERTKLISGEFQRYQVSLEKKINELHS